MTHYHYVCFDNGVFRFSGATKSEARDKAMRWFWNKQRRNG